MPISGLRVVWRADARTLARSNNLERHLKRFRPEVNRSVRALAARHPRLADLAASFPALAVALARPRRGFSPAPVIGEVIAGASLAELAASTGIPLWARKLPPECFDGLVPMLPESADFFCRIADHLPKDKARASSWLRAVAFGAHWAGEPFGVWMAREYMKARKQLRPWQRLRLPSMTLWAWHSTTTGTPAHDLIDRIWTPRIGMKAAMNAASTWWNSIDLHLRMGKAPVQDMWLAPGAVDGYRFVPLTGADEIEDEARVMKNCLRTFGPHVSEDYARLWSIRRRGARVATMQVGKRGRSPLLTVVQLEAPRNRPASPEIWWAAQKWLHGQDLIGLSDRCAGRQVELDRAVWRALWRPFWLAKKRIPDWLPLAPSERILDAL